MTTATATQALQVAHQTSKPQRHRSDTRLWIASQLLDYGSCLVLCYSQMVWGIPWVTRIWYTPGIALEVNLLKVLVLQGLLGMLILHGREQLHFGLLGSRVASAKSKPLSLRNWALVGRTIACVQVWMALLETQQCIDRPRNFASWEFWSSAYFQFYALLVLRDVFLMWPFHGLFHDNKVLYQHVHKTHHQVLKDAQGMHAFHIDLADLFVENLGAYALLLLAQYLTSSKLGIHWFAISALLAHDGALHSVNPCSSLYFNPLLDCLLRPNVCHQLHHALNDGYFLFVPIHHLLNPSRRKADAIKYNKIFKTDFQIAY